MSLNSKQNTWNTLYCIFGYNKYGGYCVPKSASSRPAALKILASEVYELKTKL